MNRRIFLATAAAASARTGLSANNTVTMGIIGCGGRGRYVANFLHEAGAHFAAAADVYLPNAERVRQWAGASTEVYQDFRRLLERKDIDAVLIATPDHWHAGATVLACEAGKDVYVEKPLSHNVREGRAMVDAARRHNRIVQAGTQHRSAPHFKEVQRIVQSGEIGHVHFVRVWNYMNLAPAGIGREPDSTVPQGLDWDYYLGPAPKVPFNRKRFLVTFRWFRDYAGGYITDFGTHRFDTVHQVMGATAPNTISAAGRRFYIDDAGDIPDMLQVTYEYPNFVLSYEACLLSGQGTGPRTPEMRYYNSKGLYDRPHGQAYYGTSGTIFCDRIGYEIFPDAKPEGKPPELTHKNTTDATRLHAARFLECVRTRERPEADVETAHRSTTVPLLGNIAYDTGRKLRWDSAKEEVIEDHDATARLGRIARPQWKWA